MEIRFAENDGLKLCWYALCILASIVELRVAPSKIHRQRRWLWVKAQRGINCLAPGGGKALSAGGECLVELEDDSGAKMRIQLKGGLVTCRTWLR